MNINSVIIIGRLTRDAELKSTANGFMVSNFSIAVNRRRKNGDQWENEAHYFDIAVFGKQAESLNQYLVKGKQIAVDGELRQDRWADRDTGQTRSKVYIAADSIQLLGGNGGEHNSHNEQGTARGGYGPESAGW